MGLLDQITDPHTQAQFKLHAARIDAALVHADLGDLYVELASSPIAPEHPDDGTKLWLQTTLPYTLYLSIRDDDGIRQWLDISTVSQGGGSSGVVQDYASVGALPSAASSEGEFARVTTASSSAVYISTKKGGSSSSLEWVPIWYFEA